MRGQALIQVSTGSIEEKDLSKAFTEKPDGTGPGRRSSIIPGVPPSGSPPGIIVPPKPLNRALHIKER